MKNEVEQIKFYDDELLGLKDQEGVIWLGMKKVILNIGLNTNQADAEIKKSQKDLLFIKHNSIQKLHVKFDEQLRDVICIKESDVPMWLAKITLTPKTKSNNPEAVNKLILYQDKCAKVLHDYFMGTEEKREDFYNNVLGINIQKLLQQNKEMKSELLSIKNDFSIFKQENEQQREQLYFLVKRFDIYNNEDCLYTRIIDDFNAKMYNSCDIKNKHYVFWEAISDWLGLDFNKLLSEKNKKQYLKNKIGMRILSYFVDNIILDRIVKNKNGHFINLQGFNSDPFNIEKNKIFNYWVDKNNHLRCCFCGKIIENPKENINFNYEHLIPKTMSGTSNTVNNIGIACVDCNTKKNSLDYITYRNQINSKDYLINRMDKWIKMYEI